MASEDTIVAVDHLTNQEHFNDTFDGLCITTERRKIKVLISSPTLCCENAGTAMFKPFGMEVLGARVLSICWGNKVKQDSDTVIDSMDDPLPQDWEDVQYAVVDVMTDRGLIQLAAYNDHNGYYPHSVYTAWEDHEDVQEI